jgi:hypothetical protein
MDDDERVRIMRWRDLADQYHLKAACALNPGSRLAFHVLAECADGVADRIEGGTLVSGVTVDRSAPSGEPDTLNAADSG